MYRRNDKNWFEEVLNSAPDISTQAPLHFQTIVKSFQPGDFYGSNTQDFIDRLASFMAAAKAIAKKSLLSREYKLIGLNQLEAKAIRFLREEIKLPNANLHSLKKAERKKFLKDYTKNFNVFKKQMEKWLTEVLVLLADNDDETTAKLTMLEIQEEEKQQTAKNGRPSILHLFELSYTAPESEATLCAGKYISAHQVVGKMTTEQLDKKKKWDERTGQPSGQVVSEDNPHYTNPSTVRNTEGLSNFLRTTFAHQNAENTEILFEGYRHSSPTPLAVDNRIRRHAMAFRQVKQLAIQIARNKLTTLPKESTSVPINISSFSLLSNNVLESLRGNNNETRQILEVTMALRYLHGREIETEIDGKPVTIRVNTNNMTMGCNFLRNLPASFGKTIQQKINHRGFVRHNKHMLDFLLENKPHDLSENIANLLSTLNFDGDYSNNRNILYTEEVLIEKYTELETAANAYEDTVVSRESTDEINKAREAYEAKEKEVNGFEQDLDYYYAILRNERKTLWYNHKSSLKEKINELFTSGDQSKKNYANILQLYYELNALYFEKNIIYKNYASGDYYFQFQARFLISSYLIDRTPDFLCKSGEDRTGRTNNIIEELLSHRHLTGRFVAYDDLKTRSSIEEQLSPVIHAYSASRETTGLNAKGSRGLQIGSFLDTQGSKHLYTSILDRKIARAAKNIYKIDAIFNPALFSSRSTVFKKHIRDTKLKKQEESINSIEERQIQILGLVNQTGALLSKINLAATNKHFSSYLLLINQYLNSSDEISSKQLLDAIKSEIFSGKHRTPWMRQIENIKTYQKKLHAERDRLIDLIDIKINISLNKKRLNAINNVLKKLNYSRIKKLFTKHEIIKNYLRSDAPKQDEILKAQVKQAVPYAHTKVNRLIPSIKKMLDAQVNKCVTTLSLLDKDLQQPKEFLKEYRFDIRIKHASSIEELNCWDALLEKHAEKYKAYEKKLNDEKELLNQLKDRYDSLLEPHTNTINQSDTTLLNCKELINEINEGMKKIKSFRELITRKAPSVKEKEQKALAEMQQKEKRTKTTPAPAYVKTITAGASFLENNSAQVLLLGTVTSAFLGANYFITAVYLLGGIGLLTKGAERLKERPNLYAFFSSSEHCRDEVDNPTNQPPILVS